MGVRIWDDLALFYIHGLNFPTPQPDKWTLRGSVLLDFVSTIHKRAVPTIQWPSFVHVGRGRVEQVFSKAGDSPSIFSGRHILYRFLSNTAFTCSILGRAPLAALTEHFHHPNGLVSDAKLPTCARTRFGRCWVLIDANDIVNDSRQGSSLSQLPWTWNCRKILNST